MKTTTGNRSAPSRKEVTHERIVGAAARATRRSGYDGTGVVDIMKEVGLTHGGFYAHFASREAMLVEAAGFEVVIVPGEAWNFKVTTPGDLGRAEFLAKDRFG